MRAAEALHVKPAALAIALVAILPITLAAPGLRSESYAGPSLGYASVLAACQEGRNVGAVCFELDGTERTATVHVEDRLHLLPAADWVALDAEFAVLGTGNACWDGAVIPEGAAYFAVTFSHVRVLSPIPECRNPGYAGTVHVMFG